jgi:undecaprenyl-diphosphatase
MDWIQALILGIIQGLTEYLPVSSSGHLAIGQAIFGMDNGEDNLMFTVAVHMATVLSTLVVLWKEIAWILKGLLLDIFQSAHPMTLQEILLTQVISMC